MDFNNWIENNNHYIDYAINMFMNFLESHKYEFNYEINDKLPNILVNYFYNTSSSVND
jgi:hypothetical protein